MSVFQTAGTLIYIGPAMTTDTDTDYQASDFNALTYTLIGNTTNLGTFGDTSAEVTADEIGRQRTRKAKGTRNAGTMALTCLKNIADPGQLALVAAEQAETDYAFKVVFPDALTTGNGPHAGTTEYFAAKVMSAADNAGGPNQFVQTNFSLGIDSNIVTVPAT